MEKVTVEYAPVSERYWSKGCEAIIQNGQIRLSGCWFDFDERFIVFPLPL
jgi:hypothetical protein